MRLHLYCVSLVLVLVGCDWNIEFSPCGWPGCLEGSRCVDHTCVPCGGAHQACCYGVVGGEYCTESGYGCDPSAGEEGLCTNECGAPGKPCCGGESCDNGSTCNSNDVCESARGDACFSGSTQHTFTIVEADCGYRWQTFWTNTIEEAEDCRDQWSTVGPGEELCPIDVSPDSSHVCKDGESFGYELSHCSAEQLAACEASFCSDCTWNTCE